MNNKEIQKEQMEEALDRAFDSLSKETQDYILSDTYVNDIINIEKKYSLSGEESQAIQLATLLALHHLYDNKTAVNEMVLALRNRSAAETEKIINEIKDRILVHA